MNTESGNRSYELARENRGQGYRFTEPSAVAPDSGVNLAEAESRDPSENAWASWTTFLLPHVLSTVMDLS